MSIQSFTLKNYRSFVDRTTIELRPLTLLFGYNNSGKSALLRALPLIADSLNGQSSTPLALDSSPAARGSLFSDLLSNISGRQEFDLELSLTDSEIRHLKWTFRGVRKRKAHIISNFGLFALNENLISGEIASSTEKLLSNEYNLQLANEASEKKTLKFEGLLLSTLSEVLPPKLMSVIEPYQRLKTINSQIQWLSSVRQLPLRNNLFQGTKFKRLSSDGGGAADVLAMDSIFEELLILPKVSSWYEKHLQQKLIVEEMADHFQIKLQHLTNLSCKVNIVDTGEGVIQVLPVLVACAMASEGDTDILAIEEPESHLHPRHHAALAAHFCELVSQKHSPKCLLETHSENFLLRVQLEIAQGKLDPELVRVYWVRQLDDGRSIAEPITFNQLGQPNDNNWPRGVFSEDVEQKREIIEAQRAYSE
ncbi:MAG: AAA family ATPase [Candidatus Parabeggiatoa sp.]|nr:AAA family ATPase [Candidatus Parabeggiatoa sp.]